MSEIDLDELLIPFRENDILLNPSGAFLTRKNKIFQSELPYSHLILFSSIEYENGVSALRKALALPPFHTTNDNGKSLYIKINDEQRVVVDFIFEHQTKERLEHYGYLLGTYLLMAETILEG